MEELLETRLRENCGEHKQRSRNAFMCLYSFVVDFQEIQNQNLLLRGLFLWYVFSSH